MKNRDEVLKLYNVELMRQDARLSTGSVGKLFEVLIRDRLMKRGINDVYDVRARGSRQMDCIVYIDGKRVNMEVKNAAGAVAYAPSGCVYEKDDIDDSIVLPSADFVVFAVDAAESIRINPDGVPYLCNLNAVYVFKRDQFVGMLEATGKHGIRSSLHITKHGKQVDIQPWTAARRKNYDTFVTSCGVMTLGEFLESIGR